MPKKSDLRCYFGCVVDGPLHRYPKWEYPHEEKFCMWKSILNPETQEKGNTYIYNNIRLCYRHFERFYQLPSHQLTRNAVPTLNITSPEHAVNTLAPVEVLPSSEQEGLISVQAPVPIQCALADDAVTIPTQVISSCSEQEVLIPAGPIAGHSVPIQCGTTCEQKIKANKTSISVSSTLKSRGFVKNKHNKEISMLKQKLLRLRGKCKTQSAKIRMAEKISKTKIFAKTLEKLPEPIQIFTNLQLKYKLKPRGRKYTLKEKILSLTILKQSPKAYNLLGKLFVLPSKRTLQKLLSYIVIKPGLNTHIIDNLQKSVVKLPLEKRLCSLIFDEVALSPGLYYNRNFKEIVGFEDYGYKKTMKIADHALVLMIKSIKGKLKQPLCFTFCQSATKKEDLKNIIIEAIKAVTATGMKIVCTICDQSSSNMSTIKTLCEATRQEYLRKGVEYKSGAFEIDGVKVFPLFDPPHLLKGMRNNLLTKNLRFIENGIIKVAKWEHIILFMEKDVEDVELRLVNKLTEAHVNKDKIPKMKVKYAAQVFSQRLSAAIKFCARHEILPKECADTADLLIKIDHLFDSFNGHSYKEQPKKFRGCLKNSAPHFKLWDELLPILRSMGFEIRKKDGTIYKEFHT